MEQSQLEAILIQWERPMHGRTEKSYQADQNTRCLYRINSVEDGKNFEELSLKNKSKGE